jgi:MFS family permease
MFIPKGRRMLGTFGSPRAGAIDADTRAPFGWAPLVVLFIVGLVDRLEGNLTSGVLPLVQAEWGFSDTAAGSIPTAAALAAVIVSLPAGYLADRRSRTRIISVVVVIWAITTVGSGLATGFAIFYLMRVLLAAADSIDNPAVGSLIADYYPPVSRAKAYGLTRLTTYLGGAGTIIGGVLGQAYGWRAPFFVMAVPGLLAAWLVWRLREPVRGELDRIVARGTAPAAEQDETPGATAPAAPASEPFWTQIRAILSTPTMLITCIGLGLLFLGLAGIFFWLPSLMVRSFGVGSGTAGAVSGAITIVGTVTGTLVGSWLGRKWHGTVKGGRLLAGGGGVTIGSVVLTVALAMDSLPALGVLMLLACSLMSIAIPTITAALADVLPAGARGAGFAVLQLMLTGGGAFGSLLVGIASDQMGSLRSGMYLLIAPMVIGGLITLASRDSYERDAQKVLDAARG